MLLGALLGGCVIEHTPPSGHKVHVLISAFEKSRATSVARQFLSTYLDCEPKEPGAMSSADFKCAGANLSEDLDDWTVAFMYSRDPLSIVVKVSRDLKSACLFEEHEGPEGDRPAIRGDGAYMVKRRLPEFRWMLSEQRNQGIR